MDQVRCRRADQPRVKKPIYFFDRFTVAFGIDEALSVGPKVLGQATDADSHLLAPAFLGHIEHDAAAAFFVGARQHLAEGVLHMPANQHWLLVVLT